MIKLLAATALACAALQPVSAQNLIGAADAEHLMRENVRIKKTEILAQALNLTDEDARKFWPLHREYEQEIAKLNDKGFELLGRYTRSAASLTDSEAQDITTEALKLEKARLAIREKYFRRISKAVSPKVAGRFVHLDSLLHSVASLQLAMNTPIPE